MSEREELAALVNGLADADVSAVLAIVRRLQVTMASLPPDDAAGLLASGYPTALALAPYDDEPVTDDDRRRLAEADADIADGRFSPADEVWGRLGA